MYNFQNVGKITSKNQYEVHLEDMHHRPQMYTHVYILCDGAKQVKALNNLSKLLLWQNIKSKNYVYQWFSLKFSFWLVNSALKQSIYNSV